ncbi:MAG: ABC transporter ATP-binding protein [bacterium]|nr:ABC transporter ATP-binding protein [bacterium]
MTPSVASPRALVAHFRTFARLARAQFLLLPPLMLVAGLFEGIGIVLFLPVLERLAAGTGASTPPLFGMALTALHLTTLPALLGAIAALFLAKFAVTLFQQLLIQRITRDLYRSLARRLIHGWTTSEYREFYLQATTGTLTNVLTRELWTFLGAFSYFCQLLVQAAYIGIYLGGSLLLDPRITSVAVAFGGVAILGLRRWMGVAGAHSLRFTAANVQFQDRLIEFLQHFKYLKATARFPTVERRLHETIEEMTAHQYRMGVIGAAMAAVPEPVAMLLLIAFLYGSVIVLGNAFAATAVLALLLYRMLMRILVLQTSWQKFVGCSGSLHAVSAAVVAAEAHPETRGTTAGATLTHAIVFDGVHFSYPAPSGGAVARAVLADVSLRIPARTTVAIVGPSGGGKSTIVDLLTGVLRPTAGRITVDGHDVCSMHRDALRATIGYVAQEIPMFNDTIAHNVDWWSHANDSEVRRRCAEASCDFIAQLPEQFATCVGERGIALSMGQRQRIAIARELFRDPELLIFDEATSALDSASEEVIRQHIERLAGKRTIVLVAHRLSTIRHADYLYVIDGGRVAEEGTYDALIANPASAFARMCALQTLST